MIAHFPYYQNSAVYRMQGRRWAREWAHKISRVPPEELPVASVRTIESYRVDVSVLRETNPPSWRSPLVLSPKFHEALFATGRYAVWRDTSFGTKDNGLIGDAGFGSYIDNEGRGWFAQPTRDNAPRINAPIDESIIVPESPDGLNATNTEWCRLDVGVVSRVYVRTVGGEGTGLALAENDFVKRGVFALTGSGEIRAWGDDTVKNNNTSATFSSRLVSGIPDGEWEQLEVTTGFFLAGSAFACAFAYAIRGNEVRTWGTRADLDDDAPYDISEARTLNFPLPIMAHEWSRVRGSDLRVYGFINARAGLIWVPVAIMTDNTPVTFNPELFFQSDCPRCYAPPYIPFFTITGPNITPEDFSDPDDRDQPDPRIFLP